MLCARLQFKSGGSAMSAQKEFDELYMTSSEIARRLGVTRAAIIQARTKGMLPDPIMVENHLTIWKRLFIEPYVKAWQEKRNARIGV
jgi:hypothetical protein